MIQRIMEINHLLQIFVRMNYQANVKKLLTFVKEPYL